MSNSGFSNVSNGRSIILPFPLSKHMTLFLLMFLFSRHLDGLNLLTEPVNVIRFKTQIPSEFRPFTIGLTPGAWTQSRTPLPLS